MPLRIVRTGTWLYDGLVERPVDIIALDYDWWFSLAKDDDQLEQDEVPLPLGSDGCLYYVRFQRALERSETTWVDSYGNQELSDAVKSAEAKVVGGIRWNE
jgi:hypothetical protein